MTLYSILHLISSLLLLSLILALEIILLCLLLSFIHSFSSSTKKILYHAINITITETELFAIRCRINQTIQILDFLTLLSSPMLYIWHKEFSILLFIHINSNWSLFQKTLDHFLRNIYLIPLNFGIVLVMKNSLFMC